MKSQIETEPGLKSQLLEDVFKLMDAQKEHNKRAAGFWDEKPKDLLISDVYLTLTKRRGDWHRPTCFQDIPVRVYQFRGNWMKPAKAVFETMLEELGFELYVAEGRAFRIRMVEDDPAA